MVYSYKMGHITTPLCHTYISRNNMVYSTIIKTLTETKFKCILSIVYRSTSCIYLDTISDFINFSHTD